MDTLADYRFVGFADGKILSWCPTMDLLAVSMNKMSVWVFRANGERVFSINNRSAILHLTWVASGKQFAVSGSDNLVKIYDSNTGALKNTLSTCSLPITLVNWCSVEMQTKPFDFQVLDAMPKLSSENEKPSLDFLFVVNANEQAAATFNDFSVGPIELPLATYLQHAMKDMYTQYLLVENEGLSIVEMNIDIGERLQHNVARIVQWCAQLMATTQHIDAQLEKLSKEASAILLLDRYMSNLRDSIGPEASPLDIKNCIMDILTSGLIPESQKDFWLDQFGEHGINRVSQAMTTVYNSCRETVYTQVVLALEKTVVLLSYLEATAQASTLTVGDALGVDFDLLKSALESSKARLKEVYAFIWRINDEQELFNKFLYWVKWEIVDVLGDSETDSNPQAAYKVLDILRFVDKHLFSLALFELRVAPCAVLGTESGSLHASFEQLRNHHQTILDGVRAYIVSKFRLESKRDVGFPAGHSYSMKHFGSVLVAAICEQTLWVAGNEKLAIQFPGEIVAYELLSESSALVLHKSDTARLDLVHFDMSREKVSLDPSMVLHSLQFGGDSHVKDPAYLAVNIANDSSHIICCVLDKMRQFYTVVSVARC